MLKLNSEIQVLLPRSILHTDSAKAYRKIGPLRWPEVGALQSEWEATAPFAAQEYTHTNVTHKKKVGQDVKWLLRKRVKLANGTEKDVIAGTEKIDGYWATLRRHVGRKGMNTGLDGSGTRAWLEMLVRVHQWEYWHFDEDRFALFGDMLAQRRAADSFF